MIHEKFCEHEDRTVTICVVSSFLQSGSQVIFGDERNRY